MFKSNPANTTVSSCVPHEPPVQISDNRYTTIPRSGHLSSFLVEERSLFDWGELEGGEHPMERHLCKSRRQLNGI